MKKSLFILMLLSFVFIAKAQQHYFVYLQTDNKQSFSVKINGKLLSSSTSGYLVLSKLSSGNQNFTVSFPKDEWAKQTFNLNIADADAGYLLKNFGEKGWGLFNMQNMDIVMSGTAPVKVKPKATISDDEFEKTLAGAANSEIVSKKEPIKKATIDEDEKPIAKVATDKADRTPVKTIVPETIDEVKETKVIVEKPVEKVDEIKTVVEEPLKNTVQNELPTKVDPSAELNQETTLSNDELIIKQHKNSKITKLNTYNDDDGVTITYKIKSDAGTEIVPIFIEKATNVFVEEEKPSIKVASNKADRAPINAKNKTEEIAAEMPIIEEKKQEEIIKTPVVEPIVEKETPVVKIEEPIKVELLNKPVVSVNSDCKAQATEDDFFKTRKKMVAEDSDDAMIEVASKLFKLKCYSVEQIKNLSLLFLNDNGKYKLFDAAYPYTSDTNNYATLEVQLKEAYFIKRFKAMLDR